MYCCCCHWQSWFGTAPVEQYPQCPTLIITESGLCLSLKPSVCPAAPLHPPPLPSPLPFYLCSPSHIPPPLPLPLWWSRDGWQSRGCRQAVCSGTARSAASSEASGALPPHRAAAAGSAGNHSDASAAWTRWRRRWHSGRGCGRLPGPSPTY